MHFSYSPLALPLLALLFALPATALALKLLAECRVLDAPSGRSNHRLPVPRGGGIAFVAVGTCFLAASGMDLRIAAGAVFLAALSFLDDLRGLPAWLRLLAQTASVALGVTVLAPFLPPLLPLWIMKLAVGFSWLWFVNLTNFMDGIDGLSALEAMSIAGGIVLVDAIRPGLPDGVALQASVLAASALAFYVFNRAPARLFMGDAGSVPLGFLLFFLLARLGASGAWPAALILPAYYVSDATFTLLARLWRRERIWQAHSAHAYQCAVRAGMSHRLVAGKITVLNGFLVALAMLSAPPMMAGGTLIVTAYAASACLMVHFFHAHSR